MAQGARHITQGEWAGMDPALHTGGPFLHPYGPSPKSVKPSFQQKFVENRKISRYFPRMLRKYRFKNFFSFLEETEVSLEVSKHVDTYGIARDEKGRRVSKVMAILGANASGKTNVLKPVVFVHWFASHSFQLPADAPIPVQPHAAAAGQPSRFETEFCLAGDVWRYRVVLTTERVVEESLHRKTSSQFSYVFLRRWSDEKNGYEFKQKGFGLKAAEVVDARQNASVLSIAAQYGVETAKVVGHFEVTSNIDFVGRLVNDTGYIAHLGAFYKEQPEYREHMEKLLRRWDLGFHGVEFEEVIPNPEEPDNKATLILGVHEGRSGTFRLSFRQESSGTIALFALLAKLLPVLHKGGVAVIDELESDLHPLMIEPVLDLFFNEETNPRNAQLLFTCHAAEVLKHLHKCQVLLVEKNEHCESEAWRLDDVKGVRADDNLYAKYLAGAYAAIPEIR